MFHGKRPEHTWDPDIIWVNVFTRWYKLRKLGKATGVELVPTLLQDGPKFWVFDNPDDPWGSASPLSMAQLILIVELAEIKAEDAGLTRKPPGSEIRLRLAKEA